MNWLPNELAPNKGNYYNHEGIALKYFHVTITHYFLVILFSAYMNHTRVTANDLNTKC